MGERYRRVLELENITARIPNSHLEYARTIKPFFKLVEGNIFLDKVSFAKRALSREDTQFARLQRMLLDPSNLEKKHVITKGLQAADKALRKTGIPHPTIDDLKETSLEILTGNGVPEPEAAFVLEFSTEDDPKEPKQPPITMETILDYKNTSVLNTGNATAIMDVTQSRDMDDAIPLRFLYGKFILVAGAKHMLTESSFDQLHRWHAMRDTLGKENAAVAIGLSNCIIAIENKLARQDETDSEPTLGLLRKTPFINLQEPSALRATFMFYLFKGNETLVFEQEPNTQHKQ